MCSRSSAALGFADRLLKEAGNEPAKWIDRGYHLALARGPSEQERAAGVEFVAAQLEERKRRSKDAAADEVRRQALADWCQVIFSLNEFLYVD